MFTRYDADPQVIWSVELSASCSRITSPLGSKRTMSSSSRPGDDDRAVAIEFGVGFASQRHLHVGRSNAKGAVLAREQDAAENLDGSTRRHGASNETENPGELVARARDLHRRGGAVSMDMI